ncbi:MAG: 2-phospho-L-lactate transferase [Pseudomonadales bacterium]
MSRSELPVLALTGGVGGAKLAAGLASVLPSAKLDIVANTGDDFEHLGLYIAPDLDSVMYALAGINDRNRGWGVANESWNFLETLTGLNGANWFQLGDRDLAVHVQRTELLRQGLSLSEATSKLCEALGIEHSLLPMSNDRVRTMVDTQLGELEFQEYFVARQCEPKVTGFRFDGQRSAMPLPAYQSRLQSNAYQAVIVCPSNPFVSVDPILGLAELKRNLGNLSVPVAAVSPIIGGKALKGPAAKMLKELDMPCDALGVARYYQGVITHFVIDEQDASLSSQIEELGMHVLCMPTIMRSVADQTQLASTLLTQLSCESA